MKNRRRTILVGPSETEKIVIVVVGVGAGKRWSGGWVGAGGR